MITALVTEVVENSMKTHEDGIHMSKEGDEILLKFRRFMFDEVYMSASLIPDRKRGSNVVKCSTTTTQKRKKTAPTTKAAFLKNKSSWQKETSPRPP